MSSLLQPSTLGVHTVVKLDGDVDIACAADLRDSLLGLVNRGVANLVIDLRGVTFIDSTGVGSLLRIYHRQTLLGGAIHFLADQPCVLRVFELMQLDRKLHIAPTLAGVERCCPALPVADLELPVAVPS